MTPQLRRLHVLYAFRASKWNLEKEYWSDVHRAHDNESL